VKGLVALRDPKVLLLGKPGDRHLLLGNEALARGAIEAGAHVFTMYPGTPASEIGDSLARIADDAGMYVEFSTNEKVALEVAAGASLAGARAMTAMKMVGLNVASDSLVTLAYVGVKGGLVIVSADDPNCFSSQNEQDNRYYALLANIPCLEPSNPQEARDMVLSAFDLSEKLELPVMLRMVTRVSHTRGPVMFGPVQKRKIGSFEKNPERFVMVPANARRRHVALLEKMDLASKMVEESPYNRITGTGTLGIITSGVSYNYCLEALRLTGIDARVLKVGTINPLPKDLISKFLQSIRETVVIEELEPYLEVQVKAIAHDAAKEARVLGKLDGFFPRSGEFSQAIVATGLAKIVGKTGGLDYEATTKKATQVEAPPRPPMLCPGCPHIASFHVIKVATEGKAIVATDIGCYALGYQPPLSVGDILISMGASAGLAAGFSKVTDDPVIGVVGDSTFFHASLPGLVNAAYNGHRFVYVVLDNLTTAMTGHQPHPGTGVTATGKTSKRVMIEELARACGVEYVKVVDPLQFEAAVSTMKEAIHQKGPAVVVFRRPCAEIEHNAPPRG
jgi:indolepyruvate ferredoxin oxidoreductase alpha subunit